MIGTTIPLYKYLFLAILLFIFYKVLNYFSHSSHSGKSDPASPHEMICSVSIVLHFSLVPSIQVLLCLWFPGPHVGSFPIASQIPSLIHCPSCISFTQLGSSVPASTQEIVLIVSAAVHLSLVPSIQVLICFWSPGPHARSSTIALHSPLLVQSPSCFAISIRIC